MKVRFLALFLFLLISGTQAISTSDFNFTSEGRGLIQSNGQAQKPLGKLYGSIEGTTRLNNKVEESKNEHKHELSNTSRKGAAGMGGRAGAAGMGGRAGAAGMGGRAGAAGMGGRAGAAGMRGRAGAAGMRGRTVVLGRSHNSASAPPSLLSGPHFWDSPFILYVSLALIILFPFHQV